MFQTRPCTAPQCRGRGQPGASPADAGSKGEAVVIPNGRRRRPARCPSARRGGVHGRPTAPCLFQSPPASISAPVCFVYGACLRIREADRTVGKLGPDDGETRAGYGLSLLVKERSGGELANGEIMVPAAPHRRETLQHRASPVSDRHPRCARTAVARRRWS